MTRSKLRIAALLMAVALVLSGCNLFKSSAPDDSAIVAEVQSKLYQDPALKTRDIHVICQKGVVVLTGTVNTPDEKTAVEQLAQSAPGAKQVIDDLSVSASTATAAEAPSAEPPQPEHQRAAHRRRRAVAENEPPPVPPAESEPAAPTPAPAPVAPPPPPPRPIRVTLPAGTVITVRTVDRIDTSINHAGDEFAATVDAPVVEGDRVVIPRYADARIRLVNARSAGRIRGRSEVDLQLVSLRVGGKTYAVDSGTYQEQAKTTRGKRSAEVIGGGAGLGALLGAVIGGGKGAAIGAAVGAGGGTAVQAGTKGQQIRIPSETRVDFTLRAPLTISMKP